MWYFSLVLEWILIIIYLWSGCYNIYFLEKGIGLKNMVLKFVFINCCFDGFFIENVFL